MYAKGVELYCARTVDDRDTWAADGHAHRPARAACFVIGGRTRSAGSDVPQDVPGRELWGGEEDWANDGHWPSWTRRCAAGGTVGRRGGDPYSEVDAAHARAERVKFDPVGHYARPDVFQLSVDERAKPSVAER